MSDSKGIVIKPGKSGQPTTEREVGLYSHICKTCGVEFIRKGKFAFLCDKCAKQVMDGKATIVSINPETGNVYLSTGEMLHESDFFNDPKVGHKVEMFHDLGYWSQKNAEESNDI